MSAAPTDRPDDGDVRLRRIESVLLDNVTELIQRHRVAGAKPDICYRTLQRDVGRLHPWKLPHGHAHGVGADGSIHSERFHFHTQELR